MIEFRHLRVIHYLLRSEKSGRINSHHKLSNPSSPNCSARDNYSLSHQRYKRTKEIRLLQSRGLATDIRYIPFYHRGVPLTIALTNCKQSHCSLINKCNAIYRAIMKSIKIIEGQNDTINNIIKIDIFLLKFSNKNCKKIKKFIYYKLPKNV